MAEPVPMVELWRGGRLESLHRGHAVICDATGQVVEGPLHVGGSLLVNGPLTVNGKLRVGGSLTTETGEMPAAWSDLPPQ